MTLTDLLAGCALALIYGSLAFMALAYEPEQDFTDTGVGCVNDCLDPMIQDEADDPRSQDRN